MPNYYDISISGRSATGRPYDVEEEATRRRRASQLYFISLSLSFLALFIITGATTFRAILPERSSSRRYRHAGRRSHSAEPDEKDAIISSAHSHLHYEAAYYYLFPHFHAHIRRH